MTDLPRFHKGNLGPINFQTLNEVMRRLDALQPLIESASVEQKRAELRLGEVFPVYAKAPDPPNPGRFIWREIIVRGQPTPEIPVSGEYDSFASDSDGDWSLISDNCQYRSGEVWLPSEKGEDPEEADTYAICIDPGFSGGFATCFAFYRTDSSRVYVLYPIGSGSGVNLIRLTGYNGEVELRHEVAENDQIFGHSYNGHEILISSNATRFTRGAAIEYLDFWLNPETNNRPSVSNDPPPELTPRTLDAGSIVLARALPGTNFYVGSVTTHFDVDCG